MYVYICYVYICYVLSVHVVMSCMPVSALPQAQAQRWYFCIDCPFYSHMTCTWFSALCPCPCTLSLSDDMFVDIRQQSHQVSQSSSEVQQVHGTSLAKTASQSVWLNYAGV